MMFRVPNVHRPQEVETAFRQIATYLNTIGPWIEVMLSNALQITMDSETPFTFTGSFTKTGADVMFGCNPPHGWFWPVEGKTFGQNVPAGKRTAILWPLDGWHGVTGINLAGQHLAGRLPSMRMAWILQTFNASGNQLSEVQADIPVFDNQTALTSLILSNNRLSERAVNQILTELVTNNGKRSPALACTVNLSGGMNAAPTGDGLAAKTALVAAGWTVTTN